MNALDNDRLIAESESKISNLDSQISSLNSQITHVRTLRVNERNRLATLKYLTSPLHVLPMELLGEIFWFTIAPVRGHYVLGNSNAIVPLSQVCHYWRMVAHSTPRFWTEFRLDVMTPPNESYIAIIKSCLDRSLRLPLSLEINLMDNSDFDVIDRILPRNRLESLEILLPIDSDFSPIASLFADPLDALHTLRMTQVPLSLDEKVDLSAFAPRLRRLIFPAHGEERIENFFSNIPWSQLTHLDFWIHNEDCMDILRQCRDLEQLEIQTFDWDLEDTNYGVAINRPHFALPNLRHFGITLSVNSDLPCIMPFFEPLEAPALTSLKIVFDFMYDWVSMGLGPFQARSPNIQWLELTSVPWTAKELIALLRSSPALKSLTLSFCKKCIDDTFLDALQYRESDAKPLVPLLEAVSWDEIGHKFQESALENMVRSRWQSADQSPTVASSPQIARLAAISIRCGRDSPLSDAFVARMRDCIDERIHFS
ncbi:hypothetical protein C8R44DRAFT_336264 [Mycena epipterygia]|nr:hypothetical protein C8R44DRAFT_336264 [Mycena epipterygia]